MCYVMYMISYADRLRYDVVLHVDVNTSIHLRGFASIPIDGRDFRTRADFELKAKRNTRLSQKVHHKFIFPLHIVSIRAIHDNGDEL